MKKIIFVAFFVLATSAALLAQPFAKGNHGINAGIGLGNGYYGAGYGFGFGINGSYEYAIVEVPMGSTLTGVVGVGGAAGVSFTNYSYGSWDGNYHYTLWFIAARGTYHFIFHDKLDPYAGITLGFQGATWTWKGDGQEPPEYSSTSGYFRPGIFVGSRYFFTSNFGVFAELGWQLNIINMGVAWKIE